MVEKAEDVAIVKTCERVSKRKKCWQSTGRAVVNRMNGGKQCEDVRRLTKGDGHALLRQ